MLSTIISKLLKAIKNVSNAKNILRNRTILSLSAVFMVNFIVFLMTGILYFRNEVYVSDEGSDYRVFTMLNDPEEILSEQGIELDGLDYYDFSGFDNDIKTAYLDIHRAITVSLTIDGILENHEARAEDTVQNILNREGIEINEFDVIKPELSAVCGNGDSIEVISALSINITVDGQTLTLPIRADSTETVKDVINRAGIELSADDIISATSGDIISATSGDIISATSGDIISATNGDIISTTNGDVVYESLESVVVEDLNIKEILIKRVRYVEKVTVNNIPYERIEKESTLYPIGHTEIITKGVNGSEKVVTREKLIDGELTDVEVISTEITNEPINEVSVHGTALATPYSKREFNEIELNNGLPIEYEYVVSGKSCAYTARAGSGTASGRKLEIGTIAVDPKVIPYGSLLYIVTQDGKTVYGAAVAADTGYFTDVVADLYMGLTEEHYADACNWGAKWVDIYVISVGTY